MEKNNEDIKMRLKPVNDKIVVKPTEDKNDNVTDGGLYNQCIHIKQKKKNNFIKIN